MKTVPKEKLLAALFAEAKKLGIDQETLRNEIAPGVIKKRLSKASGQEIIRVIEHITGNSPQPHFVGAWSPRPGQGNPAPTGGGKKYESSKSGLLQELEDVAKERWGEGFVKSLNAFVNANREIPTHYKMMGVTGLKALKERIKELNKRRGEASDSPASPNIEIN